MVSFCDFKKLLCSLSLLIQESSLTTFRESVICFVVRAEYLEQSNICGTVRENFLNTKRTTYSLLCLDTFFELVSFSPAFKVGSLLYLVAVLVF